MLKKHGVAISCCMTQFSSYRDVNGWHQFGVAKLQEREEQTGRIELQKATAKDRDLNFEIRTVSGQLQRRICPGLEVFWNNFFSLTGNKRHYCSGLVIICRVTC